MTARTAIVLVSLAALAAVSLSASCRRIRVPVPPEKSDANSATTTKAATTTSRPATVYIQYTIRRGDTLGKIAKKHNVSPYAIEKANQDIKLEERNLKVGQVIKIPLRKKRPVAPLE